MGGMTAEAILLPHGFAVGFMAIETLGNVSMGLMALITAELGVGIGDARFDLDRIDMAPGTDRFGVFKLGEIDFQRFMGIVAGGAVAHCVMG